MELKTAIEILEYHQEWRLGKREDMIHEPKKLTEALDIVLSEVKKFRLGAVSGCLYAFLYNSCIHESSWATVSLHYSKEGAEKAMQEHKQKALDEFNEMYANDNEFDFKFGEHEDWCVEPVEVLP